MRMCIDPQTSNRLACAAAMSIMQAPVDGMYCTPKWARAAMLSFEADIFEEKSSWRPELEVEPSTSWSKYGLKY